MQLSEEEIENLSIDKFIFHVVHHRNDEPILLDETPIGDFEDFFLERAMETLRGNRFTFADGSITRTLLKQVLDDEAQFVPVSKTLAQTFHAGRDKRIKPGVMILMTLVTGQRKLLSVLKYDHEEAVTYDITEDAKAILKAIANSFTKSADALQKSALIEIVDSDDNIVVVDKTVRHEITDFFRGFLACKRLFDDKQMTQAVEALVVEVVKKHQNDLPNDITQNVRDRYYDTVHKRDKFDAAEFFAEFFGAHGSAAVRASFDKGLAKKGMEGEVFKFDKGAVKKLRPQKYKTAEGVKIDVPEQASDTVKTATTAAGTVITITTSRLTNL
ncbi:nucleoid-associated protein [Mesorhizobium sp. BH1-1-4]|uniref:nucleoid-associated protein n=1 Tax=Mesorhizobium sp. BH1-1-4 TaxID=2876662 RepID=UPI001CD054F5|nr:nucleoid-associated protein [Mesorhizobium sp. BH1-1-4]MBZ9996237.1 nucleoid-associated protein [Mesorhizobium sp. BH1-1-4]